MYLNIFTELDSNYNRLQLLNVYPGTPKVSKVTVQPQQPVDLKLKVNTINRSSSAVIHTGSYLQGQAANKLKLSDSSLNMSVPHTSEGVNLLLITITHHIATSSQEDSYIL